MPAAESVNAFSQPVVSNSLVALKASQGCITSCWYESVFQLLFHLQILECILYEAVSLTDGQETWESSSGR